VSVSEFTFLPAEEDHPSQKQTVTMLPKLLWMRVLPGIASKPGNPPGNSLVAVLLRMVA